MVDVACAVILGKLVTWCSTIEGTFEDLHAVDVLVALSHSRPATSLLILSAFDLALDPVRWELLPPYMYMYMYMHDAYSYYRFLDIVSSYNTVPEGAPACTCTCTTCTS